MARSAYMKMARLGTHPAFRMSTGCLVCPFCGEAFERVPVYTRHFVAHTPDVDEARQWLDWRAFAKYETACAALDEEGAK